MKLKQALDSRARLHGRGICKAVGPDLSGATVTAEVVHRSTTVAEFRGVVQELDVIHFEHDNALLGQGLERVLRLISNNLATSLTKISHVGVGGAAGAVTVSTTTLGTPNSIKSVSPAETIDVSNAANPVVTFLADFDETDVPWAATRLALLTGSAATAVVDIVGGGGSAPYDKAFGFDFSSAGQVDLTLGVALGLSAAS